MEQLDVEDEIQSWILQVIKELRYKKITQVTLEHDLDLPPGWVAEVRRGFRKTIHLDTYLRIWKYLGRGVHISTRLGTFVDSKGEVNIETAADLTKIKKAGSFLDMSSLYASRDRALRELSNLSKYDNRSPSLDLRLQLAADNVMLINILEDLFRHARGYS